MPSVQSFAGAIDFTNPVIGTGIVVSVVVAIIAAILFRQIVVNIWQSFLRPQAKCILANLRSLPQTDRETFQAWELMLNGVVLCVLGQIFPILVLFGVVPLYYGARKLGWVFVRFHRGNQTG